MYVWTVHSVVPYWTLYYLLRQPPVKRTTDSSRAKSQSQIQDSETPSDYIWSQEFPSFVMCWNITLAESEHLWAWEIARVRSETFHLGPLPKENSTRGTEWNEFSRLKKRLFQCIWWVSRGLFATCVERQVKHNRGEKLSDGTMAEDATRLLSLPGHCQQHIS